MTKNDKDTQEYAKLWLAFEDLETLPDSLIDRIEETIINDSEGQSTLDGLATSGDWDRIFEAFLDCTKRYLLKYPGFMEKKA